MPSTPFSSQTPRNLALPIRGAQDLDHSPTIRQTPGPRSWTLQTDTPRTGFTHQGASISTGTWPHPPVGQTATLGPSNPEILRCNSNHQWTSTSNITLPHSTASEHQTREHPQSWHLAHKQADISSGTPRLAASPPQDPTAPTSGQALAPGLPGAVQPAFS